MPIKLHRTHVIIFAADLKSERIIKGLSEENSAKFLAEILENPSPKRHSSVAVEL